MQPILTVALLLPWLLIAFLGWLVYQLIRQHGQALLQQDELRERLAAAERTLQDLAGQVAGLRQPGPALANGAAAQSPAGLEVGSLAPPLALPDLDGRQRALGEFLGRPLLVVFFNTGCGFCQQMAPRLGQLPDSPRVLLVGNGDAGDYRRLAAEHGWRCDVLLDASGGAMHAYRAGGTPMGYLLDAEGRVASELAVGADAVLGLLTAAPQLPSGNGHAPGLTAEGLRDKEQAAVERGMAAGLPIRASTLNRQGLPAGTKAPGFRLRDLEGKQRSLAEFGGKQVLLVFSDPDCGPCQALTPDLVRLAEQHRADNLQVLMVSRGELAANLAKAKEHGFPFPVLLQKGWQVSKEYAMFATPVAYLIDEQGIIAKDVAVGSEAIVQLAIAVTA